MAAPGGVLRLLLLFHSFMWSGGSRLRPLRPSLRWGSPALSWSPMRKTWALRETSMRLGSLQAFVATNINSTTGVLSELSDAMFQSATVVKPSRDKRQYETLSLDNGLRVMLVSDPDTDMAAASVNVHVGHFGDPWSMPGLAHFHEHMLFLGTKDFPEEGAYEKFLAESGGSSNAWTGMEDTNFYFHASETAFPGALERFSAFFRNPLLSDGATEREMKAVDSEHKNNLPADNWRHFQIIKNLADPLHQLHKFGTGNYETLCSRSPGEQPTAEVSEQLDGRVIKSCFPEEGRDPVKDLREFNRRYYHARNMKLAVVSSRPIEEIRSYVQKHFQEVPRSPEPSVDLSSADSRFFPFENRTGMAVDVVSVREVRRVDILYPAPPIDRWRESHTYRLFSHLLGHEGPNSLHALLRRKGWARSFSAGFGLNLKDCIAFKVTAELTEEGEKNLDEVVDLMFKWVGAAAQLDRKALERIHQEEQILNKVSFDWAERGAPEDVASSLSNALEYYSPDEILVRPRIAAFFDAAGCKQVQETLTPEQAILIVTRKDHGVEDTAAAQEGHEENSSWDTEPWYGTKYRLRPFTAKDKELWSSGVGLEKENVRVDPGPNQFLVDDFTVAGAGNAALGPLEESSFTESQAMVQKAVPGAVPRDSTLRAMAPVVVQASERHRVWLKTDRAFLVPRGAYAFYLLDSSLYSNPRAFLSARFFTRILIDQLTEDLYDARLAGLGYTVSATRSGFVFRVSGYSQRLTDILEHVLLSAHKLLADMATASSPDGNIGDRSGLIRKFNEERESMLKDYRNFGKSSPAGLAGYWITQLTTDNIFAANEYNDTLLAMDATGVRPELNLEVVARDVQSFFNSPNLKLESFIAGSTDEEGAVKAVECFLTGASQLSPGLTSCIKRDSTLIESANDNALQHLPPPEKNSALSLELPRREDAVNMVGPEARFGQSALAPSIILESTSRNPKEQNCAVQVLWQLADGDEEHFADAVGSIFCSLAHTSAFQELRTKQQLGYAVSVRYGRVGASSLRMVLSLQSSALPDPRSLEQRVEGWTQLFRKELEQMDEESVRNHIEGTIVAVLEKDGRLSQEISRQEGEISSGLYEFYRRWEHVSALRKVTKESLLRLFDEYIATAAKNRRCLVSRTYSQEAADRNSMDAKNGDPSLEDAKDAVPVLEGLEDVRAFKSQLPPMGKTRVVRDSF